MADLTEQNIREIEVLVEARGVEMKELSYDLVDHICCMIEEKMEGGSTYSNALEESIASFGKKGIRQIQEETTFLLTKNILAMRKTMHITGITSAILLLIGSIFKIQHWPGAGLMYVLGGVSLCLVFMPLFLAVRIKEKPGKLSTFTNVIGILSAIALCIGILFKIMYWPWANILMNSGGTILMFFFLPLYIYNGVKTKSVKTRTIVPVIVAIAGFSLMFSLVRLQGSHNVRISRANYHNNINQNIKSALSLNEILANKLKNDSTIDTKTINTINQLATSINSISNDIGTKFIKSNLTKYSDEEIKHKEQTDFENFSLTIGKLRVIQDKEKGLPQLLSLVKSYEKAYVEATGVNPNLLINNNFNYYLDKQNKMFALRFVLRDLNALNLQVQQLHTSLLQYYKGKVS